MKKSIIVSLTALFLISVFIVVAQQIQQYGQGYTTVDRTFNPLSSGDCGNQNEDCLIATMSGMLASANAHRVGTNTTRIADRMMTLTNHRRDGTTLDEAINATIVILNGGLA